MSLTLVTAPPVLPVTEAEVWAHLKVNLTGSPPAPADQSHILGLINAVVDELDGQAGTLGRAIVMQTWDLKMPSFPAARTMAVGYQGPQPAADAIRVPLPPLQSVASIAYVDNNGDSQTLSSALYTVDTASQPGLIVPAYGEAWPATRDAIDAVTVRFVAGYPSDGASPPDYRPNVPDTIKTAIKLKVEALYDRDPRDFEMLNRAGDRLLAMLGPGLGG
jgi:uncharacterized phiE125 gp8 family phage protein